MKKLALIFSLVALSLCSPAAGSDDPINGPDPGVSEPGPPDLGEQAQLDPNATGGLLDGGGIGLQQIGVTEGLYSYGGATGSVRITSVDNSGWSRSLTMYQSICKDTTVLGRLIEYKMNFGPSVSTDWKGGVSRGLNAGCSSGYRTDTFYYPNVARGVWARVCIDDPGPINRCGTSEYISI